MHLRLAIAVADEHAYLVRSSFEMRRSSVADEGYLMIYDRWLLLKGLFIDTPELKEGVWWWVLNGRAETPFSRGGYVRKASGYTHRFSEKDTTDIEKHTSARIIWRKWIYHNWKKQHRSYKGEVEEGGQTYVFTRNEIILMRADAVHAKMRMSKFPQQWPIEPA